MVGHINGEMVAQSCRVFGGAPCFSNQTIDIGSHHRECAVDVKQGGFCMLFKFALARNGGLNTFASQVLVFGEKVLDYGWVTGVYIGMKDCLKFIQLDIVTFIEDCVNNIERQNYLFQRIHLKPLIPLHDLYRYLKILNGQQQQLHGFMLLHLFSIHLGLDPRLP